MHIRNEYTEDRKKPDNMSDSAFFLKTVIWHVYPHTSDSTY